MHKLGNITGTARHGWEKTFRPGVPNVDMSMGSTVKRPMGSAPMTPVTPADTTVHLSFNVAFSSNLAGPDADDILHASPGALEKWLHPEGTPEDTPTHKLPVHVQNVESLRNLCREMCESSGMRRLEASVTSAEPNALPVLTRRPLKGLITNVCLSGDQDLVQRSRARILTETPLELRCAFVDIDNHLVIDNDTVKTSILEHIDIIASYTGTSLFVLGPKLESPEAVGSSFNGSPDTGLGDRLRVAIYGDMESSEHAKARVLIMVDQILKRNVDAMKLELSMHTLICGRTRQNIKLIESATNTAIYFPPPFSRLYGYNPPGAHRRPEDEVFITADTPESIAQAKTKLHDLIMSTKCYVKDVKVSPNKIDNILLERLDKVRKIMETNGSYILFPQLGNSRGVVRVQGTEILHVERTVRELMALAGQFYGAHWIVRTDPNTVRTPSPADIRTMLSDVCTNSGADVSFTNTTFSINGSDDTVKAAMMVIHQSPFVQRAPYELRVKIELANEHKEFVSGKKNGKINKIMSQSNVQILFDGFNEYNFYIDVCGSQYDATMNGLDLVEQEMPASISFHVPDQYHKRIIGIGGAHIQRIMKKHSVFVKFSNAMDRGGLGREDDDFKVDNVICRTPARNAQNLDLVKSEIMDMVEKVDAECVEESVVINRLYHRQLISRILELDALEKKWNCKINFPSTEMASDIIVISGPEFQVPQAVDEFLSMVPEDHELVFPGSDDLKEFLKSTDFHANVKDKLKSQYEVDLEIKAHVKKDDEEDAPDTDCLLLTYTRNHAGGLKDAIDLVIARLVAHGLDATTIKGAIPRPKSDSFEDSLPFFNSKLLQNAPTPIITESPTKQTFISDTTERSIFDRLRKPGSMASISSFLDRRKNQNSSPGSFFKNKSSNGSMASLVSIESAHSGYRNPWNDSGVNLPEEESPGSGWPSRHVSGDSSKFPFIFSNHSAPFPPFGVTAGGGFNGGGDATPKYDPRASFDSGRPSTSHSASGYPGHSVPPR
ncbi:MAG: hypothetical protein M1814_006351 [Vezdaea aestivalis]|nr:MAG: hypothetical protein M1814_006351 [Vezdaea aestivalis]